MEKMADQVIGKRRWTPNPGPQTDAFYSKADIMLYGGAGGGGKSDLGVGLACTEHKRSLIMRRKYTDLAFLTDRTIEVIGTKKGFNGSAPPRFDLGDQCLIEYGAAMAVGDELSWMGRPHDLLYIDEAAHFAEVQIRNLMGWVRSTTKGQRVRVVLGSNPPLSDEGIWMFTMFAPWLDPAYPDPALPGELRYCVVDDNDQDVWVGGPGLYDRENFDKVSDDTSIYIEGTVTALSRTFIPAKLADNPFQNTAEYRAQQDGLPKHMRDAIRDGNFLTVRKDHDLQVIPTEWITKSMETWEQMEKAPDNVPMCAIAADLTGMQSTTGGGKQDNFVLSSRHDGYFRELIVVPGKSAGDGKKKAGLILTHREDVCPVGLDMGGGYGDATYEALRNNGVEAKQYKGSNKSKKKTRKSKIKFYNKRAEVYIRLMEGLDPDQPGGAKIILPKDELLRADLCSIRYDENHDDINIIKLEPKKKLKSRLGRSTDYGDPVAICWSLGAKMESDYYTWQNKSRGPVVVLSSRSRNRNRSRARAPRRR